MYAAAILIVALLCVGVLVFRGAPPETPWLKVLGPVSVSVLMVLWTIAVSPTTSLNDSWATWPVIAMLPAVLLWHVVVVAVVRGYRGLASVIAVYHLSVFSLLWLGCLMQISKSSL